jgi:hypothetical protein
MSRRDAVLLASRRLSVLITIWALTELSYLPERLHSFLHYANGDAGASLYVEHMRHHDLIVVASLLIRIIGFLLLALWLRRSGPEVMELLLPLEQQDDASGNIR